MTEGKRPGGLTALAVLNFVFGGFGVLGLLGLVAFVALLGPASEAVESSGDPEAQAAIKAWKDIGMPLFYAILLLMAATTFLQIASGVGYLQQKRFLGRTLGNTYAVVSIVAGLLMALRVADEAGGGFSIGTLVGLVYPVLTLILLNTTFKEDFIR